MVNSTSNAEKRGSPKILVEAVKGGWILDNHYQRLELLKTNLTGIPVINMINFENSDS